MGLRSRNKTDETFGLKHALHVGQPALQGVHREHGPEIITHLFTRKCDGGNW
jgi:hypothetical protein